MPSYVYSSPTIVMVGAEVLEWGFWGRGGAGADEGSAVSRTGRGSKALYFGGSIVGFRDVGFVVDAGDLGTEMWVGGCVRGKLERSNEM